MIRRARSGFTLIEVLVVVVVIAIASGFVIVNLGGGGDRRAAEREATRLAGALEHAAALAQWKARRWACRRKAAPTASGGARRTTGGALADDDVLAARALPADFTVAPAAYAGAPVAADAILPFRPSGRNEPYALLLASPAWSMVVAGDPLNRVQVAAHAASR